MSFSGTCAHSPALCSSDSALSVLDHTKNQMALSSPSCETAHLPVSLSRSWECAERQIKPSCNRTHRCAILKDLCCLKGCLVLLPAVTMTLTKISYWEISTMKDGHSLWPLSAKPFPLWWVYFCRIREKGWQILKHHCIDVVSDPQNIWDWYYHQTIFRITFYALKSTVLLCSVLIQGESC